MMKYVIPAIKIESFLSENIVTGSGGQPQYINEVNKTISTMSQKEYKTGAGSVDDLLQYN